MLGANEQRDAIVQYLTTIAAERVVAEQLFVFSREGRDDHKAILPTMNHICQLQGQLENVVGNPLALAMLFQERQTALIRPGKKREELRFLP